ncbi:hypothetical protein ACH4RG_23365 [Streptomyces sp. NPDC021019]|uniref:hypothetical protein n=1 Tax=Streptomyces sp. NPDC021019 TaxID=3365108 RepID=UPI0037A75E69
MSAHPQDLEVEAHTAVIVLLLAEVTTSQERNALKRLALRAGLMWRCHPCRTDLYLTADTCTCGAHRPAHLISPRRSSTP